jgi:hypothetical protein
MNGCVGNVAKFREVWYHHHIGHTAKTPRFSVITWRGALQELDHAFQRSPKPSQSWISETAKTILLAILLYFFGTPLFLSTNSAK